MHKRSSNEATLLFSERLRQCMRGKVISEGGTALSRAFNLRSTGSPVTTHAARKWIKGEAIPTQDKILVLAEWFEVSPEWLRFGGKTGAPSNREKALDSVRSSIIFDTAVLTEAECTVVRALITALLKVRTSTDRQSDQSPNGPVK